MRMEGIDTLKRGPWAIVAALLALVLVVPSTSVAETAEPPPLILILDASGSMWGQIDGENKIVIARRAVGELIDGLPAESPVGLVAYGHRREGDCSDIETIQPIAPLDATALKASLNALQPKGKTPITASIERALKIAEESGEQATIILLSDGLETCGGDPCKTVRLAKEGGAQLVLHVVGFDVEGEDLSQLQCIAQAGGGLFLGANDAGELGTALEQAVALTVDEPAGRLVVHATADDKLADVSVRVRREDGSEAGVARTYTRKETNPTSIPLADGKYEVQIRGLGIKGDHTRRFSIEIIDGGTVEKTVDFSTGEIAVGATRNGDLSDVSFRIYVAGTNEEVGAGRTYTSEKSNPNRVRLTSGRYDVKIKRLEVANKDSVTVGTFEVMAKGLSEAQHAFTSGTLRIGALKGGERIDTVVYVKEAEGGGRIAQSRTYTGPKTNPKTFELLPGRYTVGAKTLGKGSQHKELEVVIEASGTVTQDFEF